MRAVRGFTLIEIIIVICILGVLASMAVPRLVVQIKYAEQAAAAFQNFGVFKRTFEQCYQATDGFDSCNTFSALGILPSSLTGRTFGRVAIMDCTDADGYCGFWLMVGAKEQPWYYMTLTPNAEGRLDAAFQLSDSLAQGIFQRVGAAFTVAADPIGGYMDLAGHSFADIKP